MFCISVTYHIISNYRNIQFGIIVYFYLHYALCNDIQLMCSCVYAKFIFQKKTFSTSHKWGKANVFLQSSWTRFCGVEKCLRSEKSSFQVCGDFYRGVELYSPTAILRQKSKFWYNLTCCPNAIDKEVSS